MKVIKIPKKNGSFRTVVVPSKGLKKFLRFFVPQFEALCLLLDRGEVMQGFLPGRSPVTNAMRHIGYKYSVCFDLEDFFDHVTYAKLRTVETGYHSNRVNLHWNWFNFLHDDVAFQGLPTSPLLANIAAVPLDRSIGYEIEYCQKLFGDRLVYTRYADDLTISCDSEQSVRKLLHRIPYLCKESGFPVNAKKTHVQKASSGRRIITGVAVDDKGVYPTRKMKRKLRAAEHKRTKSACGLREWVKTKPPTSDGFFRRILEKADLANELIERDRCWDFKEGLVKLHNTYQMHRALKAVEEYVVETEENMGEEVEHLT